MSDTQHACGCDGARRCQFHGGAQPQAPPEGSLAELRAGTLIPHQSSFGDQSYNDGVREAFDRIQPHWEALVSERDRAQLQVRCYQRVEERNAICPDHRDKGTGTCIVCQAETRTRREVSAELDRVRREMEALATAILPDETKRADPYWTVANLTSLASAHREDSEILERLERHCEGDHHVWLTGETLCQCGRAAGQWGARTWTTSDLDIVRRYERHLRNMWLPHNEVLTVQELADALRALLAVVDRIGPSVDMLVAFHALHPEQVNEETIRAAFADLIADAKNELAMGRDPQR